MEESVRVTHTILSRLFGLFVEELVCVSANEYLIHAVGLEVIKERSLVRVKY